MFIKHFCPAARNTQGGKSNR